MKEMTRFARIIMLAATVIAPTLQGQQASGTSTSDIEPEAIAALNKMGAYLRTLRVLQVRAETTHEEVLVDGQKIQFASVTDLVAQAPNQLRALVKSDTEDRLYLYDGKTFTLYAPRVNYYATVPAPPTTVELINRLEEKYGMEIPLTDLFRWGGPNSSVDQIKAAGDIGPSEVEGTTCEHYAFRQPGLDWQIWIQLGDYPLPRKLVLTTLTDSAQPQFTAVYTWNLAPSFNAATFQFVPPPDSHKIELVEVSSASGSGKR